MSLTLLSVKHTYKSQESMLTERLIHDVWIIFTDGLPRGLPLPLEFDWENSSVAAQKYLKTCHWASDPWEAWFMGLSWEMESFFVHVDGWLFV